MKRFLLILIFLLGLAPLARAQVRYTLDGNSTIKLSLFTTANADNTIDGLNAGASQGKQFDPRLIPGGGGSGAEGTFVEFQLELTHDFPNFEVKASKNNFTSPNFQERCCYYFNSFNPLDYGSDPDCNVFFSIPGSADPNSDSRKVFKMQLYQPLSEQVNYNPTIKSVVVQPSHVDQWETFMPSSAASTVWIAIRVSRYGVTEKDSEGRDLWFVVTPHHRAVRTVLP